MDIEHKTGKTEHGIEYDGIAVYTDACVLLTVRRYPKNTFVVVEDLGHTASVDIADIGDGYIVAKVRNERFSINSLPRLVRDWVELGEVEMAQIRREWVSTPCELVRLIARLTPDDTEEGR